MGSRFWRMYAAYFTTTIGDELYIVALPLVLLQLGYAAATATFLRGALTGATVLAGLTMGYLIDRHDTYYLLSRSYGISAVFLIAASGALAAGVDGFLVALAAAAVLGLFAAITAAAVDAGIPRTVSDQRSIRHGYSLVESARTIAVIAGPAFAGLLVTTGSLLIVTLANAASFALAALLSRARRPIPVEAPQTHPPRIRDGLRMVATDTRLRLGITLSLLGNLTLGAEQPLFLARMVQDFGLSASVTAVVVALAGAASVVASTITVRHARAVPAGTAMVVAVAVLAATAAGVGLAPGPVPASALYALFSVAVICYGVYWRTYRQDVTPGELLGRVSATCRSIAYSGIVVGVLVVGVLQELGVSTRTLLTVGGLVCLAGVAVVGPLVRRVTAEVRQAPRPS
jgi:MFS family permease